MRLMRFDERCIGRTVLPKPSRQHRDGRRSAWHRLGVGLYLGLVAALLPSRYCEAQHGTWVLTDFGGNYSNAPALTSMPLTVRPRDLVLGTQTQKAGRYTLDPRGYSLAYVSDQCVGTRRCPLVVILHDDAQKPNDVVELWAPVFDKYGMILLAPWRGGWEFEEEAEARDAVDTAMKQVLTQFAIDPERIALIAHWSSGRAAMGLGGHRLDLFSRVVLATSDFSETNVDPGNHTTQFLLTETLANTRNILTRMQALRRDGHPVKAFVGFRREAAHAEDHEWDVIARWLQQSWAAPGRQPAPAVVARTVPLLTTANLQKMIAFWARFTSEPDSIQAAARWAHQHEVALPVPEEQLSLLMTDMPALAAQYPSVAADLKAAGLTAQEHDAYRVALATANALHEALRTPVNQLDTLFAGDMPTLSIDPASVLAKDIEFVKQSRALIGTTKSEKMSDMWHTP